MTVLRCLAASCSPVVLSLLTGDACANYLTFTKRLGWRSGTYEAIVSILVRLFSWGANLNLLLLLQIRLAAMLMPE